MLETGNALVAAGRQLRAIDLVRKRRVKDVVDKGRLPRPRHTCDCHEAAQREGDVKSTQVVFTRALDHELTLLVRRATGGRYVDLAAAGQIRTGDGGARLQQLAHRTGHHDLSPVLAGLRADVDHPVGSTDGVFVVLDDDQRVA